MVKSVNAGKLGLAERNHVDFARGKIVADKLIPRKKCRLCRDVTLAIADGKNAWGVVSKANLALTFCRRQKASPYAGEAGIGRNPCYD